MIQWILSEHSIGDNQGSLNEEKQGGYKKDKVSGKNSCKKTASK